MVSIITLDRQPFYCGRPFEGKYRVHTYIYTLQLSTFHMGGILDQGPRFTSSRSWICERVALRMSNTRAIAQKMVMLACERATLE
jgi:hypothetical protein